MKTEVRNRMSVTLVENDDVRARLAADEIAAQQRTEQHDRQLKLKPLGSYPGGSLLMTGLIRLTRGDLSPEEIQSAWRRTQLTFEFLIERREELQELRG